MKLIGAIISMALLGSWILSADKPSPPVISDKDRAEAFRLRGDIASVQVQFLQMKAQYEATVKQMQESVAVTTKAFDALKAALHKTCTDGGMVLDENQMVCAAKPVAPALTPKSAAPPDR